MRALTLLPRIIARELWTTWKGLLNLDPFGQRGLPARAFDLDQDFLNRAMTRRRAATVSLGHGEIGHIDVGATEIGEDALRKIAKILMPPQNKLGLRKRLLHDVDEPRPTWHFRQHSTLHLGLGKDVSPRGRTQKLNIGRGEEIGIVAKREMHFGHRIGNELRKDWDKGVPPLVKLARAHTMAGMARHVFVRQDD